MQRSNTIPGKKKNNREFQREITFVLLEKNKNPPEGELKRKKDVDTTKQNKMEPAFSPENKFHTFFLQAI